MSRDYAYDDHPDGRPMDPDVISSLQARVSHGIRGHSGAKWPWSRCKSCYSCCLPITQRTLLSSIPKKLSDPVEPRPNSVGYGMQAVTRIAVSKIIAVFLVWHTGPVCFAIYWLKDHPGDLQNATILLSIIGVLFAVYVDIMFRLRR